MIKGVDISHWNKITDWNDLKDNADFVIVKAGGGDQGIYTDSCFLRYFREANVHFKKRGVYWYLGSTTESGIKKEIDYLITILKDVKERHGCTATLPIFIDIETQRQQATPNIQANLKAGLTQLEKAGFYAGFYTYKAFYDQRFVGLEKRFYCWIADYRNTMKSYYQTHGDQFKIHQYSGSGTIGGVDGKIDLDVLYSDPSSTIVKKKLNLNP